MFSIYFSGSIQCVVIYIKIPLSLSLYCGSFITSVRVTLESFFMIVFKYVALMFMPYFITSLLDFSENI